jgi:hypothetical protein
MLLLGNELVLGGVELKKVGGSWSTDALGVPMLNANSLLVGQPTDCKRTVMLRTCAEPRHSKCAIVDLRARADSLHLSGACIV